MRSLWCRHAMHCEREEGLIHLHRTCFATYNRRATLMLARLAGEHDVRAHQYRSHAQMSV